MAPIARQPAAPIVVSFPSAAARDASVLILGSMPGVASLTAGQYYAHPHNQFWRIMGELTSVDQSMPYERRLRQLQQNGIALWDVIARCRRPGSLDSNIKHHSVEVNDLGSLFVRCSEIRAVFFNGQKAATLYRRFVYPELSPRFQRLHCETLPSTSPANAAIKPAEKLARWSVIQQYL